MNNKVAAFGQRRAGVYLLSEIYNPDDTGSSVQNLNKVIPAVGSLVIDDTIGNHNTLYVVYSVDAVSHRSTLVNANILNIGDSTEEWYQYGNIGYMLFYNETPVNMYYKTHDAILYPTKTYYRKVETDGGVTYQEVITTAGQQVNEDYYEVRSCYEIIADGRLSIYGGNGSPSFTIYKSGAINSVTTSTEILSWFYVDENDEVVETSQIPMDKFLTPEDEQTSEGYVYRPKKFYTPIKPVQGERYLLVVFDGSGRVTAQSVLEAQQMLGLDQLRLSNRVIIGFDVTANQYDENTNTCYLLQGQNVSDLIFYCKLQYGDGMTYEPSSGDSNLFVYGLEDINTNILGTYEVLVKYFLPPQERIDLNTRNYEISETERYIYKTITVSVRDDLSLGVSKISPIFVYTQDGYQILPVVYFNNYEGSVISRYSHNVVGFGNSVDVKHVVTLQYPINGKIVSNKYDVYFKNGMTNNGVWYYYTDSNTGSIIYYGKSPRPKLTKTNFVLTRDMTYNTGKNYYIKDSITGNFVAHHGTGTITSDMLIYENVSDSNYYTPFTFVSNTNHNEKECFLEHYYYNACPPKQYQQVSIPVPTHFRIRKVNWNNYENDGSDDQVMPIVTDPIKIDDYFTSTVREINLTQPLFDSESNTDQPATAIIEFLYTSDEISQNSYKVLFGVGVDVVDDQRVINNVFGEVYVTATGDDSTASPSEPYFNTLSAAIRVNPTIIFVEGGNTDSITNSNIASAENIQLIVNSGSVCNDANIDILCYGYASIGEEVEISSGINGFINGGTLNGDVCFGDVANKPNARITRTGTINATITNGSFVANKKVAGGSMYNLTGDNGSVDVADINLVITGGVFNGTVFGGCIANTEAHGEATTANDIVITLNATENHIDMKDLVVGSENLGLVRSTKLILKGNANYIGVSGKIIGTSSNPNANDVIADGRVNGVSGSRTLVLDGFNGNFSCADIVGFDTIEIKNSSIVTLSSTTYDFSDIKTWYLENGSLLRGPIVADLTGANIIITGVAPNALTNEMPIITTTIPNGITNYSEISSVRICNEPAVYHEGKWISNNYEFGINRSNSNTITLYVKKIYEQSSGIEYPIFEYNSTTGHYGYYDTESGRFIDLPVVNGYYVYTDINNVPHNVAIYTPPSIRGVSVTAPTNGNNTPVNVYLVFSNEQYINSVTYTETPLVGNPSSGSYDLTNGIDIYHNGNITFTVYDIYNNTTTRTIPIRNIKVALPEYNFSIVDRVPTVTFTPAANTTVKYKLRNGSAWDSNWSIYDPTDPQNNTFTFPDGSICIIYKSVDQYGNESETKTVIDHYGVAPTTSSLIVIPPTVSTTSPTNQNVTVSASSSGGYGTVTMYYQIGSTEGTWIEGNSVTVGENCTVYFKAVDGTGAEAIQSIVISNIDKTAPSAAPTVTPSVDPGTQTNSQEITLSSPEQGGLVEYSLDGGSTWTTYNQPFTVVENCSILTRVTDQAGNTTTAQSPYVVSNITEIAAPVITYTINQETNIATANISFDERSINRSYKIGSLVSGEYIYGQSVVVTNSSVSNIRVNPSGATGSYRIVAESKTPMSNTAKNSTQTILVEEQVQPVVVPAPSEYGFGSCYISTNYTRNYVGVMQIESYIPQISDDGTTWHDMSYHVGLPAGGGLTVQEYREECNVNKTVYLRNRDNNGNYSESVSYTVHSVFSVQKNSASTTEVGIIDCGAAPSDVTLYYCQHDSLTNEPILYGKSYPINDLYTAPDVSASAWTVWDRTRSIFANKNGRYWFMSLYSSNGITQRTYRCIDFENIAPENVIVTHTPTTVTNTDVTMSVSNANKFSRIEYCKNDGQDSWHNYTEAVTVTENASYIFKAVTNHQVELAQVTHTISNIDKVAPPQPQVTQDITAPTTSNVTMTATCSESGVIIEYTTSAPGSSSRNWTTVGTNGTVVAQGNATYYFRTRDNAGNTSAEVVKVIDNIAGSSAPADPQFVVSGFNQHGYTNDAIIIESITWDAAIPAENRKYTLSWDVDPNPYHNGALLEHTYDANDFPIRMENDDDVIHAYGSDIYGRSVENSYIAHGIDKTAPIVELELNTTNMTQSVKVYVTISDYSGIALKQYIKVYDNTVPTSSSNWTALTSNRIDVSDNCKVYVRAIDIADNETMESITISNIYTFQAPTVNSYSTSPASSVTLTADFHNAPIKEYSFDNQSWSTYSESQGVYVTSNTTVYFRSGDGNGNYLTSSVTVSNIDSIPNPVSVAAYKYSNGTRGDSIELTYSHGVYSMNGPVNTDIEIILTSSANATSIKYYYESDSTNTSTYSTHLILTESKSVTGFATNSIGDSDTRTIEVQIDKVAPTITNIQSSNTSPTNQTVRITATFSDNDTVVSKAYRIGTTGDWTTYPDNGAPVSSNCDVYFRAIDAAGNETISNAFTVSNISTAAAATPTFVQYTNNVANDTTTWTNSNVVVRIYFDPDSTTCYVAETSSASETPASNSWTSVSMHGSGNNENYYDYTVSSNKTVHAYSINNYGNESAKSKHTVTNIDKTNPVIGTPTSTPPQSTPTNQDVTVSVSMSDSDSNISKKEYRLGTNGTWTEFSGNGVTVTTNCDIYFRATDGAGNTAETSTAFEVRNIDKIAPNAPSNIRRDTTAPAQTVRVYADSPEAGCVMKYSTNGTNWYNYPSAGVTVTTNNTTVYFKAIDAAGNESTTASILVDNVDRIPPDAPTYSKSLNQANDEVTVTASYSGGESGITIEYSTNGTSWSTYSSALTTAQNTTYYFRTKDSAGNVSSTVTCEVNELSTGLISNIRIMVINTQTGQFEPLVGNIDSGKTGHVFADFDSSTSSQQYRIDGGSWSAYVQMFGVIVSDNCLVEFRANGDDSTIVEYHVNVFPPFPNAIWNGSEWGFYTNDNVWVPYFKNQDDTWCYDIDDGQGNIIHYYYDGSRWIMILN